MNKLENRKIETIKRTKSPFFEKNLENGETFT